MKSSDVKFAKYTRWKAKKAYSDKITMLYWRYSHKINGDFLSQQKK